MISATPTFEALAPYALADLDDPTATSLAQNESAFPPSPLSLDAGNVALCSSALYPDPDWRDLRTAIAEVHPVTGASILCGAGSMELIGAIIRAFAGPGDVVLGTQFGYAFAETAARQAGARFVRASEPALTVSVDAILDCIVPRTRLVFLCNPGNPTGTRIPNDEILRLRRSLPADTLLVIDQAYAEFDLQDHAPIFGLVSRGDTVVLRTFSKAYALAGHRVGWGAFPPRIAAETRKALNPNNVSVVSQAAACAAMEDQGYMRDIVRQTIYLRDSAAAQLRMLGLTVPESHTNFLLLRFTDPKAAQHADRRLRAAKLILRGMGGYGLHDALRATVGPGAAMQRLIDTLTEAKDVR